ncbi:MAG TPA: CGGC domain-containing protein [Sedimentisphaerales bacterium]|nr:CGGC domain-containing protein [Sedimentisphaerales bacterium]
MIDLAQKEYIIVVQCDIVKQRCPGYLCEKAFHERTGGFECYPMDKPYRIMNLTCGGCCGRAIHRKLTNFLRVAAKKENITKDKVVVQLSSCMTKDNFHASQCPHLDYIKGLIEKTGLDIKEDTVISQSAEKRREQGIYKSNEA